MISAFEYITVLISIILGLGITQILTGIADLIHQSKRVKIYWPHALWVIVVLILHVQDWWTTFDLRSFGSWSLPLFLFIMVYPVVLFVLARLLFPFGLQEGVIDLKEFYFENYRKIFAFGSLLPLLSILDAVLVREIEIETQLVKLLLPTILLVVAIRKKPYAEWVHQLISLVFFAILTITIIIEWNNWILST
jgi:hypothetical protein